jgi:hypothetical protein
MDLLNQPKYKLQDLIDACSIGSTRVYVFNKAMKTASSDFGLHTQAGLLDFIANNGLENPRFKNSKPWENNPEPNTQIMVDAWEFFSSFTYGYIAFFLQPKTNAWIIKSFKKNTEPDPRNLALKEQLEKLRNLH